MKQKRTGATGAVSEREAKANRSPASSEEDRDSTLQLVQKTIRSEIRRVTLEKTFEERKTLNQAVVRMSPVPDSRNHPPASIKQAMEMQAEDERRKPEEILQSDGDEQSEINLARGQQQDCDCVEQQSSVQDPTG